MPLAFKSVSHGTIAFGFFNIEVDLLLLEELFFWADDFCSMIEDISAYSSDLEGYLKGYRLKKGMSVGNLHGAIAGYDLSGFIGSLYTMFPFPDNPEGFKQKPEGFKNREAIKFQMDNYLDSVEISYQWKPKDGYFQLNNYRFNDKNFKELVRYVFVGGMPRWLDDKKPDYVNRMVETINKLNSSLSIDFLKKSD